MQLSKCEVLDQYICKLTLCAEKEEFDAACAKVKEAQPTLEQNDVWFEAVNACMDASWGELFAAALAQTGVTPLDEPIFDLTRVDENGFEATATIPTMPETVTLGQYKGVAVDAQPYEVSQATIDSRMHMKWLQTYTLKEQKGPAVKNNAVFVDYTLSAEGVVFKQPQAENVKLFIGGAEPFRGMGAAINGHKAGETVHCSVRVAPAQIASGGEGKTVEADCAIVIRQVCLKEYEQMGDAFARKHTEYGSEAEWRAALVAEQAAREEAEARKKAQQAAVGVAAKAIHCPMLTMPIETVYYDRYMSRMLATTFPKPGSFEQYLNSQHLSPGAYKMKVLPGIEAQIRSRIMLLEIARVEGLEPTEEELEAMWAQIARSDRTTPQEAKANHSPYLARYECMLQKATDLVQQSAVVNMLPPVKAPQPKAARTAGQTKRSKK